MPDIACSIFGKDAICSRMLDETTQETLIKMASPREISKRDVAVNGDVFRDVVAIDDANAQQVGELNSD